MPKKYIMIYAVFVCFALFLIENIFHLTYGIGVITKILLFAIIPIIVGKVLDISLGRFGNFSRKSLGYGTVFGLLGGGIVLASFLLFKDVVDWESIHLSMKNRNINESTFLLIFAYITFGNSLLEEYFFRGVVFHNMKNIHKTFAYVFSALLFSLYHLFIFSTWFSGYLILIALLGLFIGGLFFAWLYEKTNGIWGAWIFHVFADLVIVIIGYSLFFA